MNRLRELAKARPAAQGVSPLLFWIGTAAMAAGVLAIYSPSLSYPFILDDKLFIGDRRVQFPGHVGEYFTNAAWAQFAGGPASFYRPLFVVWLRINFILNQASPWGWHFLSVLKHAWVAALLGWLAWVLLRDRMAALIAGGLFAFHPAHTESVAWISVPDPLMAGGVLGAVLLYLRYRDLPFRREVRSSIRIEAPRGKSARKAHKVVVKHPSEAVGYRPSGAWLASSALLYSAALLVKETAIVALIVLLALALVDRKGQGFRARAIPVLRDMSPFLAATLAYILLRRHAMGGRLVAPTQHWTWTTVALSWPATLWFYLKVLFWPVRFRAFGDPSRTDAFSASGVLVPALAVCCAIALLVIGGVWAWRKARRELAAAEALGVECALIMGALLVALPLVPALNFNALNPDDYLHGRYAYLPSAGVMLLAATGWDLAARWRRPLLLAAGAIVVVFAALTVSQEAAWSSDMSVFAEGQRNAPRNVFVARNLVRAHVQQALEWDTAGRCQEALPVFEHAVRQYPDDWYGWAGLGDCLDKLDELPRAEEALHRAADLAGQALVTERWQAVREKLGDGAGRSVK